MISTFRRDDEICALLGYYAASSGNPLPTFRDNVFVSPSLNSRTSKMGPMYCPETSVEDYHSTLPYTPEERRSHCGILLFADPKTALVFKILNICNFTEI
jgi:hypothetical protein